MIDPVAVDSANALQNLPSAHAEEVFTDLLKRPGIRIERIVSAGQASADNYFYDQAQAEWVMLLQGEAQLDLEIDGRWQRQFLQTGGYAFLPSHCRHRVHSTSANPVTVWLAIYFDESCI